MYPSLASSHPHRPHPPLPGTLERGLWDALHGFAGAAQRWDQWRQVGLSDADLLEVIAAEFGIAGGLCGPSNEPCSFRGGHRPAFWYGEMSPRGRPTLRGRTLVRYVREILDIPQPGRPRQGRLF